jgi:hypothetical protein
MYNLCIHIENVIFEYERLKQAMEGYCDQKLFKRILSKDKFALPQIPKLHLPTKTVKEKKSDVIEYVSNIEVE